MVNDEPVPPFIQVPDIPEQRLSGSQLTLYQHLAGMDQDLADKYSGAVLVLSYSHVERIPQAAYSMRELMDRLPAHVGVPLSKPADLGSQVQGLRDQWNRVKGDADDGVGDITRRLRRFLSSLGAFFEGFQHRSPRVQERTARLMRALDPARQSLAGPLEQDLVKRWMDLFDDFNSILHGRVVRAGIVESLIGEVEDVLLNFLSPSAVEHRELLEALVQEGEA